MKTHWTISLPLLLSSGIALAPFARPQEHEPSESAQDTEESSRAPTRREQAREAGELLDADELVFRLVRPKSMDSRQLYELVEEVRGRRFCITERGGFNGPASSNLTWMNDSFLVMDRQAEVDEILALVAQLDGLGDEAQGGPLRSLEFQPRYLALESLERALLPFHRQVPDPGNPRVSTSNMTMFPERSLILLRDTEERVDEMLRLLTKLDVPPPQVRITVWVAESEALEDDEAAETGGLPAELTDDLAALLPGFAFESDGFSVVQTSVASGRAVELEIDGGIETYAIRLQPQAYDADSGHLTLSRCDFVKRWTPPQPGNPGSMGFQSSTRTSQLFSTSAVLRMGEYTVLGASGRSPVFLVVRVDRLSPR